MSMTHIPNYDPCDEALAREYGEFFVRTTHSMSGITLHISHPDATEDDPRPLCGDDRPDEWIPKDMGVYPEGSKDICRVCRKVINRMVDTAIGVCMECGSKDMDKFGRCGFCEACDRLDIGNVHPRSER